MKDETEETTRRMENSSLDEQRNLLKTLNLMNEMPKFRSELSDIETVEDTLTTDVRPRDVVFGNLKTYDIIYERDQAQMQQSDANLKKIPTQPPVIYGHEKMFGGEGRVEL